MAWHRGKGSSFHHCLCPGGGSSEARTPLGGVSYTSTPIRKDDAFDSGGAVYLLAKTYLDCREYRRAARVLQNQVECKALFLRCYVLYMRARKKGKPKHLTIFYGWKIIRRLAQNLEAARKNRLRNKMFVIKGTRNH